MELFKLFGTIAINNSDANEQISKTTGEAEKSGNKIGDAFGKIGNAAKVAAKASAVAISAVATGLGALAKSAISDYADYEQLVGGVETLFGTGGKSAREYADSVGKSVSEIGSEYNKLQAAQDKVLENANNAYKTAGLSANEYMETVTSFSAALIQSLDGDTLAAAKKADMAITDMSDNANKMGTSMESIQNAYQGFAKQNYTMLDNLKLGYGGTKEEMERLLEDATKLSGVEYDISSYADIVDAIHVVQDNLGITGTTAKEASETISGSIGMMKSSWENFLTGMADPSQDFDALLGNLVDSVVTVADNLVPRIAQTLPRLVSGLVSVVQSLSGYIPDIIGQLLPALIEGSTALIKGVVDVLPTVIQLIIDSLPMFIDGIIQIFNGIIEALPQIIQVLCNALPDVLPTLIEGVSALILGIANELPQMIQAIIDALPTIITSITGALTENLPELIAATIVLIAGLAEALPEIIQVLIDCLPVIFDQIMTALAEIFAPLITWVSEGMNNIMAAVQPIIDWIKNVLGNIKNFITSVFNNIRTTAQTVWNAIKTAIMTPINAAKTAISSVFNAVKTTISSVFNGIWSTTTSIWNAVKDAIVSPIETAKNMISGILDTISGLFSSLNISFPSIPLPHFAISPAGWKIGDLLKGSIPSLSIEWYAKAMNNPMIMEQATAFGVNGNGQIMAGGEKGSEVVSGTETLMKMISQAVAEQNGALIAVLTNILDAILNMDDNMGGNLCEAIAGTSLKVNNREFARLVKAVN